MKILALILALAIGHIVSGQPGGYREIEPENGVYSQEVQNLRDYGAQVVVERATEHGQVPPGNYEVAETYKVEQQVANGLNYRYDVELANEENVRVRTTYVVYYQAWTDTREVTSYSIDWVTSDEGIPVEEEAVWDSQEEEWLGEEEGLAGGYTELDLDYVKKDEDIQNLLNYGVGYVTNQAASQGRLPNSRFTISQVYSVSRQVANGANYRCDVEITDGKGLYVRAYYEIYSQPWTGTQKVTYYNYEITSIPGENQYENYEEGIMYTEEVPVEAVVPVKEEEVVYAEEDVVIVEKEEEKEEK